MMWHPFFLWLDIQRCMLDATNLMRMHPQYLEMEIKRLDKEGYIEPDIAPDDDFPGISRGSNSSSRVSAG